MGPLVKVKQWGEPFKPKNRSKLQGDAVQAKAATNILPTKAALLNVESALWGNKQAEHVDKTYGRDMRTRFLDRIRALGHMKRTCGRDI